MGPSGIEPCVREWGSERELRREDLLAGLGLSGV